MCGIVYYKNFNNQSVVTSVINRYFKQRERGLDGFGFYIPQMDRLTHNTREQRILHLLAKGPAASEVLYHHRMPTSTANVRNAAHPFSTKHNFKNQYVFVHNGVIYNPSELHAIHEQIGLDYVSEQSDGSFNDSESLMYDLALYLEGRQTGLKAQGSIAFVMIKRDPEGKATNLYFGRNIGSPLWMSKTDSELSLASETTKGDKAIKVEPNQLYDFNYATRALTKTYLYIPNYSYTPGLGGHWWDQESKSYISEYSDEDNFSEVYEQGEALAYQLFADADNDVDLALRDVEDQIDGLLGRLNRLGPLMANLKPGSRKFNRRLQEKTNLDLKLEIAEQAQWTLTDMNVGSLPAVIT